MMGVLDEFSLGERLRPADINFFIEQGIPPEYLARTWSGTYSFLQRDLVRFDASGFEFGRYLPHADAATLKQAFVFVLFGDDAQPADLAAWRSDQELALWRNEVWALGQEQVYAPRLGEPLHVHGSVLDWFRAGREGLVILNHARAAWPLRLTGTLAVETKQEADQLTRLLALPPPPIVVSPFVSIDLDQHADLHGAVA